MSLTSKRQVLIMHKIDKQLLNFDNFYTDDGRIENKLFKTRLNNSNAFRDTVYKYSNEVLGMTYKLNVEINDSIHINDVHKPIMNIPFDQIEYVQFGIVRLLGSFVSVPTNMYYLLVYVEEKNSFKFGMIDNSIRHYFDYSHLLRDHGFPLEDPFDIEHMDLSNRTQSYDYLENNYVRLAIKAGYYDK